jgi:hypothetical protein
VGAFAIRQLISLCRAYRAGSKTSPGLNLPHWALKFGSRGCANEACLWPFGVFISYLTPPCAQVITLFNSIAFSLTWGFLIASQRRTRAYISPISAFHVSRVAPPAILPLCTRTSSIEYESKRSPYSPANSRMAFWADLIFANLRNSPGIFSGSYTRNQLPRPPRPKSRSSASTPSAFHS